MNIENIISDPQFVKLAMETMAMKKDYDEDYLVPFELDDVDEDGNKIVQTRQGDYGKDIQYVGVKHIKERLDLAFNRKWSFLIVAERRENEPFPRWSKKDEDYVDGDYYLRCIGMMIVPGFGIRMEYGIKKTRGSNEATDWKACKTDAFKKCAEAFGIYLNYDIEDDDEDSIPKSGKKGSKKSKLDLSDVEYTDDDLEDALSEVVTFGKYADLTLGDIAEEDIKYLEWLAENARDDDMKDYASIVLKSKQDEESEKKNRRNKGNRKEKYSASEKQSRRNLGLDDDEEDEKPARRGKSSRRSNEDDEERQELMDACIEALDDYDKSQARTIIKSVSTSSKHKGGKTKVEDLSLNELRDLADVLDI